MKRIIKSLIPPLLWDKLQYIRSYRHFLKYKTLVSKNNELKNIYKGKRCFILGSGPSINMEDLKPLKNEIVFALNNFYVHEDFAEVMSGNVPKYYMAAPIHLPQSEVEWKSWFEDMEKYMPEDTNMLFGLNEYHSNIKYIFDKYGIFKKHKINWYFSGVITGEYYNLDKKDIDMTNMVWSANTVSIYALIAAIYMGFDKIYLLGMDHNHMCISEKDARFYKKAIHQKDELKRLLNGKSYSKLAFESLSKIFKSYEILNKQKSKIINLSTNTTIDIFEKKLLKKIIDGE